MIPYEPLINHRGYSSSDESGEERVGFLEKEASSPTSTVDESLQIPPAQPRRTYKVAFIASWVVFTILIVVANFTKLATNILASDPFDVTSHAPEKALVLASYSGQNTSWLDNVPPDWKVYHYNLDDPSPTTNLTVPRNQGREAMAYLTFILTHYHSLPHYTVFLHGHARSWHQPEPIVWKLRSLQIPLLEKEGYINLRCGLKPGCSADTILGAAHPEPRDHPLVRQMMPTFWSHMFQPSHSQWDFGPYPPELGQACCAQFAVTRANILLRPKEFYAAFRRPMERDVSEYKPIFGELWDWYRMGILYEHVWHVVFDKEAVHCPEPSVCRRRYFGDLVRCSNYTGNYEHSAGWGKIRCVNAWDSEVSEVTEGEVDEWGGWDGVRDPGDVERLLAGVGGGSADLEDGVDVAVVGESGPEQDPEEAAEKEHIEKQKAEAAVAWYNKKLKEVPAPSE